MFIKCSMKLLFTELLINASIKMSYVTHDMIIKINQFFTARGVFRVSQKTKLAHIRFTLF